jgi:hypothetical protein
MFTKLISYDRAGSGGTLTMRVFVCTSKAMNNALDFEEGLWHEIIDERAPASDIPAPVTSLSISRFAASSYYLAAMTLTTSSSSLFQTLDILSQPVFDAVSVEMVQTAIIIICGFDWIQSDSLSGCVGG